MKLFSNNGQMGSNGVGNSRLIWNVILWKKNALENKAVIVECTLNKFKFFITFHFSKKFDEGSTLS